VKLTSEKEIEKKEIEKKEIEKKEIENALLRNWSINAKDIHVNVAGTNVTLTGKVLSWYQKDEAERMAWNAPGVWTVNNNLAIEQAD
jgi:osmotically-inducible protein OsmY